MSRSPCPRHAFPALVLGWPALALAQSQGGAAPGMAASVAQMVIGLGLVLGLLFGALWLLKRLSVNAGAGAGLMRVVAGIAVGPRERVVLVEIGDTWLVLGVAPGQVNSLHQLPRSELPAAEAGVTPSQSFRGWLDKALERRHVTR